MNFVYPNIQTVLKVLLVTNCWRNKLKKAITAFSKTPYGVIIWHPPNTHPKFAHSGYPNIQINHSKKKKEPQIQLPYCELIFTDFWAWNLHSKKDRSPDNRSATVPLVCPLRCLCARYCNLPETRRSSFNGEFVHLCERKYKAYREFFSDWKVRYFPVRPES